VYFDPRQKKGSMAGRRLQKSVVDNCEPRRF
jgi:hypothetical protein